MPRLTAKDLIRFSITATEANSYHLTTSDLKGLTEILPNKKYRIVISNGFKKDGSRDRYTETFDGTLLQAIERKKEIRKDIEDSNINADANSNFEEFSRLYCKYLEEKVTNNQLDLTTYEGYYNLMSKHIIPFFKNMIIKEINERDIERWIATLEKTKTQRGSFLHRTTIAHAYKLLHNMFNFAKLDRILKENPCEFVKKKPTEAPEEKEVFTIEEMDYIKKLLMTANIRLKTAMFLVLDTGCRREEIIGLKWEDIDFENLKIDINKAVVTTSTNAPISNKRVREKGVKTKNSQRRIGIPSVCANLLNQYRNFKKDSGLKVKDNDYVFTNWNNNKVWDPNRFTAEWATFRKENGITKNVAVHGIRHSNATYLLSTGMPKKDVAKRLGHTPEMLDRVYTHSTEEDDEKLVEIIENRYKENNLNKDIKENEFLTASIISVVSGYVDNEYRNENYKLMDYLTDDHICQDNIDKYLDQCQKYLLEIYPVLDIFRDQNIISDFDVFQKKMNDFVSMIGNTKNVKKPNNIVEQSIDYKI